MIKDRAFHLNQARVARDTANAEHVQLRQPDGSYRPATPAEQRKQAKAMNNLAAAHERLAAGKAS